MGGRTRRTTAAEEGGAEEEKKGRGRGKAAEGTRQERLSALTATLKARYPDHIYTGEDYTMAWAVSHGIQAKDPR